MLKDISDTRYRKLDFAVNHRQFDLTVVLENIHDPHNVAAIFRTCDAVGIPKVHTCYTQEKTPRISKKVSASGFKWVERVIHKDAQSVVNVLKQEGYKIYASSLQPESVSLYDLDFTEKTALVMGNEHRGVSDEFTALADATYYIPMWGLVQSLNVSVAAAISLYEAMRQKFNAGNYDKSALPPEELKLFFEKYVNKR